MKAIVYSEYGGPEVLHLAEIATPIPKEKEVLVKICAASVNPLDCWRFKLPSIVVRAMNGGRWQPPTTILGADLAGRVVAVGRAVTTFQPGDEVFGVSTGSLGAFAEYACAPENQLAQKPTNLSFDAAATVPVAALTALQALRHQGQIQAGQEVLIQGASGGVGTFAVQIAKALGAEVTAVCSRRNVARALAIGADYVIDYTQKDFTKNGQRYDLILAVNGYHPLRHYQRALRPSGRCVVIGGALAQIFQAILLGPLLSRMGSKQMSFMGIAKPNQRDLLFLGDLLAAKKIVPVIERCYPFNEVAEAVKVVGDGHAGGKVVIAVEQTHP